MSRTSLALTAGVVLTLLWLIAATATPYSERAKHFEESRSPRVEAFGSSGMSSTSALSGFLDVRRDASSAQLTNLVPDVRAVRRAAAGEGLSFDDISREMKPRAAVGSSILDGDTFCDDAGAKVVDIKRGLDHPTFEKLCHPQLADVR